MLFFIRGGDGKLGELDGVGFGAGDSKKAGRVAELRRLNAGDGDELSIPQAAPSGGEFFTRSHEVAGIGWDSSDAPGTTGGIFGDAIEEVLRLGEGRFGNHASPIGDIFI